MKLSLLVLVALVSCVCAATKWRELSEDYTFSKYLEEFGKDYASPAEKAKREARFTENLAKILQHNREDHSWKMGVNHMTDMFQEEYKAMRGYDKGLAWNMKKEFAPHVPRTEPLPEHVDWRSKHILTAVKDQGHCGSCWTFATTEVIESYYALKTGQLQDLSEQQVLDCVSNDNECGGVGGCMGGIAQIIYEYFIKNPAQTIEWTYPYTSYFGDAQDCKYNASTMRVGATLRSYVNVDSNNAEATMEALASEGPLAVNVDASQWSHYEEGVYTGCNMSQNVDIDHVVQLVGYGVDHYHSDEPLGFWIIRNSWSTNWGEDGYMRLYRAPELTCGTDSDPLDGVGCKGGPATQHVCGSCGVLYDVSYPVV